MKNQTQIEKKNRPAARVSQSKAAKPAQLHRNGNKRHPIKEIQISLQCRDGLCALAARIGIVDRMKIAAPAIRNYLDFIEQYPTLAEAQPRYANCTESLFLDEQPLSERLARICGIYSLDHGQVANSAISVYLEWARRQQGAFGQLVTANPGDILPEQIAYLLWRPSQSARNYFDEAVAKFPQLPFDATVERARALLGLIMPHPGFEKERIALEMIIEGASRLA
jgi:hypothetical protein